MYDRQKTLFDPERDNVPALVIGAGTIGSWTTFGLSKLGVKDIYVIDNDIVEEVNIPVQLYSLRDAQTKLPKVAALSSRVSSNTNRGLRMSGQFIDETTDLNNLLFYKVGCTPSTITDSTAIVISCVDNMKARQDIFKILKVANGAKFRYLWLIDGRMAGQVIQVYTCNLPSDSSVKEYEQTLYSDDLSTIKNDEIREISEAKCTERAIVDVSFTIAGLIIRLYRMIAKGQPPNSSYHIDMRNLQYFTV